MRRVLAFEQLFQGKMCSRTPDDDITVMRLNLDAFTIIKPDGPVRSPQGAVSRSSFPISQL